MPTRQPINKLLVVIMLAASALSLSAGERQESLRTALKGADRFTVGGVRLDKQDQQGKPFESRDVAKITGLISSLNFDDDESGFHCMCFGDAIVTFYRGDKKLAEISHHHGRSLRWNGGNWKGDSLFTEEAAKAWREWFKRNGEPRFENMHQAEVHRRELEREIHEKFLSFYPAEAPAVFSEAAKEGWDAFSDSRDRGTKEWRASKHTKDLMALFPDRRMAALAIARSLGALSRGAASEGSWSVSSIREALALDSAFMLGAEEFLFLVEQEDQLALLGAARLFFFEDFDDLLPKAQRGPIAARLCEAVLKGDHAHNAGDAVRYLKRYDCPETTELLTRLASGEVSAASESLDFEKDPQTRVAAALILARRQLPATPALIMSLEKLPELRAIDREALKVSRALLGENGLLTKEVFQLDSYISYDALRALEAQRDKAALEAIIEGAVAHRYAGVREEGILAVERMTGKRWNKSEDEMSEEEREMFDFRLSEHYAKQVAAWWEANRESFSLPEKDASKSNRPKTDKG